MKETLHIKNFGPIKEVKLELGKVNVLIGDQGTGKSTVAKLICAIRQCVFLENFDKDGIIIKETPINQYFETQIDYFGIQNYIQPNTLLLMHSEKFSFLYSEGKVKTEIKPFGFDRLEEAVRIANDIFIPTERIYLSALSDSIYSLAEINAPLPKFFLRFGSEFNTYKRKKKSFDFNDLINISYSLENGDYWVVCSNGQKISLLESSSAAQGLIPMLIVNNESIVAFKNLNSLHKKGNTIPLTVVEEPELNLFPKTQKGLVGILVANIKEKVNLDTQENYLRQLLLTTHSPYILTSLNNLMYAYTVGQKHKENVSKIIPEKYWLNPADVSAYMLVYDEKEGGCIAKNILDEKEGLIDAENIDGVSSIINEEFDKLINIEIGVENESN